MLWDTRLSGRLIKIVSCLPEEVTIGSHAFSAIYVISEIFKDEILVKSLELSPFAPMHSPSEPRCYVVSRGQHHTRLARRTAQNVTES